MTIPTEMSAEDNAAFLQMQEATNGPQPEIEEAEPEPVVEEPSGEDDETDPEVGDQQAKDGRQKMVPHEALHEARLKLKSNDEELRSLRNFKATMAERFRIADEIKRQPQPEEDPEPNVEEDPFGHGKWVARQVASLREQYQQGIQQTQHQAAEQHRWNQFTESYKADAIAFAQKTPDFLEAYNYVANQVIREFERTSENPEEARQKAILYERDVVWKAQQKGQSASEIIYEMAKDRGYRPAAAETVPDAAATSIQRKANGIQQNRSLSSAGGTSGKPSMAMEDIVKMSQPEYAKWVSNPKNLERMEYLAGKGQR